MLETPKAFRYNRINLCYNHEGYYNGLSAGIQQVLNTLE